MRLRLKEGDCKAGIVPGGGEGGGKLKYSVRTAAKNRRGAQLGVVDGRRACLAVQSCPLSATTQ